MADRSRIDGQPAAYLCQGFVCRLPVTTPEALAEQLGSAQATFRLERSPGRSMESP
jgi:hypothetical protein